MKILCITGMSEPDLKQSYDLLRRAGMAGELTSERNPDLDMKEWHKRFFAGETQPDSIRHPGRSWELLAGDLFIANMNLPLWGWYESLSTWLLDFWADFEPKIRFLLVCTPPDYQLARAVEDVAGPPPDAADITASWMEHHRRLLEFYHRLNDRCLLVDARDCAIHVGDLVQHCADEWYMPLGETGNEAPGPAPPGTLAAHLAADFLRAQPEAAALWREMNATLTRFGPAPEKKIIPAAEIISSFRALCDRSREQQRIADLEAGISGLQNDLKKVRSELTSAGSEIEKARDEQGKLAAQHEKQVETLAAERDRLRAESSGLKERFDTLTRQQRETVEENDLLLQQLHQVQEELERYYLENRDADTRLEQAEARWRRMLDHHPEYCDYGSVTIDPVEEEPESLSWDIRDLEIAGRRFPELRVTTFELAGVAGFRILRDGQENAAGPLLRWPAAASGEQRLTIIPVAETSEDVKARVALLRSLAAGDWQLFQRLSGFFKNCLQKHALAGHLPRDRRISAQAAFDRFLELAAAFPASLRFDTVSLHREHIDENYEHLWLVLENVRYRDLECSNFGFRLACANVGPDAFGSDPRLEFPAAAAEESLKSWFEESRDDFGPKLEVRFALPDAMDLDVWQKLASEDEALIKALVQQLPDILTELRESRVTIERPWEDWLELSRNIERIVKEQTGGSG